MNNEDATSGTGLLTLKEVAENLGEGDLFLGCIFQGEAHSI